MRSYIKYDMVGFNKQDRGPDRDWAITLKDSRPYIYENHPFLHSVCIDEHLTSIIFELQEGKSGLEYVKEVSHELNRITFNIISRYPNIPIDKPICHLTAIVDKSGEKYINRAHDRMALGDEVFFARTQSIDELYEEALSSDIAIKNKAEKYHEIFCILQCSDRVIQFLGLYDMMASLISDLYTAVNKSTQEKVHIFFGKNKDRYPKVSFEKSTQNPNKSEDIFTHIRNEIAHSMQIGVGEYLEVAQGITFSSIQCMLVVINDLLCEAVKV